MNTKMTARGVPHDIDFTIILTEKNAKTWSLTPFWTCSRDKRPATEKRQHTSIDTLRFCEGWCWDEYENYWIRLIKRPFGKKDTREITLIAGDLIDNYQPIKTTSVPFKSKDLKWTEVERMATFSKEWYCGKVYDNWFNWMENREFITQTRECKNCVGTFWKVNLNLSRIPNSLLPGWYVYGGRWIYTDGDEWKNSNGPRSFCHKNPIDQRNYNRRHYIQEKVWGKVKDYEDWQIEMIQRRKK
jgi:hypothetical protein